MDTIRYKTGYIQKSQSGHAAYTIDPHDPGSDKSFMAVSCGQHQ